jgi:hypothetical protein
VYNAVAKTCIPCYDYYYTTDWQTCTPQPFPTKLTNYGNQYLILEFSRPVKFTGVKGITDVMEVSISGSKAPYAFGWSAPYYSPNTFQQKVFIQLTLKTILTGKEAVFVYLNNIYFSDAVGYPLLARNSTSKFEYLPLS